MSEPLISVIVPVYKVESYLHQCVESILNQTYQNLEIILVDDSSPDNCPAICDEYAKKDSRIKVIHKENGGLSSARNAGLDICTGEYIGFVDSDDYLDVAMYQKLLKSLFDCKADMAVCGYTYVDEEGNVLADKAKSPIENGIFHSEEIFSKMVADRGWFYVTAVNKLYKKQIFDELRFPEGKTHEDEFTAHYIIEKCTVITTVKNCLYFYVQRKDSIMHSEKKTLSCDKCWSGYDRYFFFKRKGYSEYAKTTWLGIYIALFDALQHFDYLPNKSGFNLVIRKIMFARAELRTVKIILIVLKKAAMETFNRKRENHESTI